MALYARVSTNYQETENQLIELRRYALARGWEAEEFVDSGVSGLVGDDKRPALKSLMSTVRKRKFDAVICWDFSRFARSMRQLVEALDEFRALRVAFISLREGIDTTTANGRLMFGIFASLAEFERELIRERVLLGLKRAKAAGKQLGRPQIRINTATLLKYRQDGRSSRWIARELGIGKDTVRRMLAQNPVPISAV